jgi:transcription elongation factor Elf1
MDEDKFIAITSKGAVYKYRKYRTCVKCGYGHLLTDPALLYDKDTNTLIRTCRCCGYEWHEQCKDGSEPIIS